MDPEIAVTTIESLSDALLGRIFATAGWQAGMNAGACTAAAAAAFLS